MSLLLTDNALPGSSNGMMLGFLVEVRGMEKLVIVVISLVFLIFCFLDRKHVTHVYVYIIVCVISVENALYLKNGLCYSFPHLAIC